MLIRGAAFAIQGITDRSQHKVNLGGEMDLSSLPAFEAAIDDACRVRAEAVVLDLSGLEFLDVAGVRAICIARTRIVGSGMELRIIPGPRNVHRLFEFAGLVEELPFQASAAAGS